MTEKGKQFIESLDKDEALKAKTHALFESYKGKNPDQDEVVQAMLAIAKEAGVELAAEDLAVDQHSQELDDDELEQVTGGGCTCAMRGHGADLDCNCNYNGSGGKRANCSCIYSGGGVGPLVGAGCICSNGGTGS
jgi:bacteriocin-like protein